MTELTAARLRELLHYDDETGVFRWLRPPVKRSRDGAAGHTDKEGYRRIRLDGGQYFCHRLAWLYVHDRWPSLQIDHRNGDKADNRIVNLREVTNAVNQENLRAARNTSSTGLLGVWVHRNGMFRASIKVNGKTMHLGTYKAADEAHQAYLTAKRQLHQGCTI